MKIFRSIVVALLSAMVGTACFAQSTSGSEMANGAVSSSRAVAVVADSSVPVNSVVASDNTSPANNPGEPNDRGFTFTTSFTGSHDSASGWSSEIDSSARYDFNSVFGVEVGMPYYILYSGYSTAGVASGSLSARNIVTVLTAKPPLVNTYNALGDLYLKLHFAAPNSSFGYTAAITGTAPTGNTSVGISTGRPTFDLNNHIEHNFGFFTPLAEFGFGDSSALADQQLSSRQANRFAGHPVLAESVARQISRPYTSLGPLSHFRAGGTLDFLKIFSFEGSGYEDLPVGDQKIYSHLFLPAKNGGIIQIANGKRRRFESVRVATGQGIGEDNGLTGELTINLNRYMALDGTYQHSLRQHFDTVAFGISFTFGKGAQPSSGQ